MALLKRPTAGKELISLGVVVVTPYSSAAVENLLCEFSELVAFRFRLRRFLQRADEGVASMHSLMPLFDLSLTATLKDTVHTEVRLSSDVRFERHLYDFESTEEEVTLFAQNLDYVLVSLPLEAARA